MKNKVLVKIMIPEIDEKFDLFLPINKRIGNIILLVNKAISDLSNSNYTLSDTAIFYNKLTGESYNPSSLLRETNIRNGTILILM